jgi:TPR repeat protein
MNEVGALLADLCVFTTATTWFRRSIRCGSIAAVFNLAKVSYDTNDFVTALSLFTSHFRQTGSLLTGLEIAKTLSMLELTEQSMVWLRFCAANGMPMAVRELTRLLDAQSHAVSSFIRWSLITKRYEIPDQTDSFSNLLLATPKRNEFLPSLSALHRQAAVSVADVVPTQQVSSYAPVLGRQASIFHPFPIMTGQTKSQQFLFILEYASESYDKRNLRACETAIKGFRLTDPVFPYDCALWRFKCASERSEDLVACGFISCVLNDFEFALSLFKQAASTGSETGALMCGLILYYGWSVERNVAQGLFCMNRCGMDPIALAHCGLCAGDGPDWSARAADIIGDEGMDFLYEKIGDIFYDGIKIPKNNRAAIAWYAMQLGKSQMKGHDTRALVVKLSRVVHEQNCAL